MHQKSTTINQKLYSIENVKKMIVIIMNTIQFCLIKYNYYLLPTNKLAEHKSSKQIIGKN